MNYDRVYWLVGRYWSGSTSVEEENELRHLLFHEDVPDDLLFLKSQFKAYSEFANIRMGDDFEQKFWKTVGVEKGNGNVVNQPKESIAGNRKRVVFLLTGIAASLIILLTVWVSTDVFNSKNTLYHSNNKALAYKQAAAALSVLAVNFDKGLAQTQQAAKPLNTGIKMLNNVGMVNKGIENLKPINKISNLEIIKYNNNH